MVELRPSFVNIYQMAIITGSFSNFHHARLYIVVTHDRFSPVALHNGSKFIHVQNIQVTRNGRVNDDLSTHSSIMVPLRE